jgi:hypothetical protein
MGGIFRRIFDTKLNPHRKIIGVRRKNRTVYVVINTKLFQILNSTVQLGILHSYKKYVTLCRAVVFSLG